MATEWIKAIQLRKKKRKKKKTEQKTKQKKPWPG